MIEDYSKYNYTPLELLHYIFRGLIGTSILGLLFYRSVIGILILCPVILLYLKRKKKELIRKRRWKLNLEFRDGIQSVSASLAVGYSVEHAFEEAIKDLSLLYHKDSMIIREFRYLINQISMNIPVEKALLDFGERTGIEDILSFADVFATAKRTGGDLISVIKTTSDTISDKIEVQREIITLITAKRLEANIMKLIPAGILSYLSVAYPGFLKPLYHNTFGIFVMTILLGVYMAAFLMIEKLVTIEV